jgi:hypothetical protein
MVTRAITLLVKRKKYERAANKIQHVIPVNLADMVRFFIRYISAQPVNRVMGQQTAFVHNQVMHAARFI